MARGKSIQNKDKKTAWDEFSRYIKVRDCLKATGLPFAGRCITCKRQYHISYLQAGHALPGRSNAKLLNDKLVFAQCNWCNITNHGEKEKYDKEMIKLYGEAKFDKMKVEANVLIRDNEMDFESKALEYKRKYEKMMRKHGYRTYSEMLQMTRD